MSEERGKAGEGQVESRSGRGAVKEWLWREPLSGVCVLTWCESSSGVCVMTRRGVSHCLGGRHHMVWRAVVSQQYLEA